MHIYVEPVGAVIVIMWTIVSLYSTMYINVYKTYREEIHRYGFIGQLWYLPVSIVIILFDLVACLFREKK